MNQYARPDDANAMTAAARLYHAYMTGLMLTLVTRRSTADAAEWVFRVFRHQSAPSATAHQPDGGDHHDHDYRREKLASAIRAALNGCLIEAAE